MASRTTCWLLALLSVAVAARADVILPATPRDLERATLQLRAQWLGIDLTRPLAEQKPADIKLALRYAGELKPDGSWADIDYANPCRSAWPAAQHPQRILTLAIAEHQPGITKEERAQLKAACLSAMAWWRLHDPQNPNWWYNVIGVPQALGYQPPELPHIVLEGIFTPRSTVAPLLANAGLRADWWLDRFAHLATFGLMVRDRGEGSVREIAGRIVLRYRLHPEDMRDMAQGLLLIAEAFFAAGAKAVLLPLSEGPHEVPSLDALRQIRLADFTPARLVASGFHPQGTAGIGRVVDADLRLTARISVCDASVLPDSPGVNPQLAIMGLSLRLADRLTAELAPAPG